MLSVTDQSFIAPQNQLVISQTHKRTRTDDLTSEISEDLKGSTSEEETDLIAPKALKKISIDTSDGIVEDVQNVANVALESRTQIVSNSPNTQASTQPEKNDLGKIWNQLSNAMYNDHVEGSIRSKVEKYLEHFSAMRLYLINNKKRSELDVHIDQLKILRNFVLSRPRVFDGVATVRKIDRIILVIDLRSWEKDPQVTGNKKEALIKITRAFESNSKTLSLANLNLNELPRCIDLLTHLQSLDLSYNSLKDFSDSLGDLTQLTHLNLGSNCIDEFPQFITSLRTLYELSLTNNQLTKLPEDIWNQFQPRILYLEGNLIDKLPDSLQNLLTIDHFFSFSC